MGNKDSAGLLTRSIDNKYLYLGGYDAPVGFATVARTTAPRVIARIDANIVVETKWTVSKTLTTGNDPIHSVVAVNETSAWICDNTGVYQRTLAGSGLTVPINAIGSAYSCRIFDNQLYVGTGRGLLQVGGLPMSSSVFTQLTNDATVADFFMADLNSTIVGKGENVPTDIVQNTSYLLDKL